MEPTRSQRILVVDDEPSIVDAVATSLRYEGFAVKGGAEGVGKSTTASVVISIFLIILTDVIFTAIFYYTG